ncbi:MAG: DsbA family oxidoreductase [Microthrixaceae bacterium]
MRIDIWSDVICPWCYLGARRFVAALDQVGRDGVEVHWRAFQLDPSAPREPGDLRTALERKYGPGSFDSMTQRLESLGRDEGIEYRFDRALRANTADAHRLIAWAGASGTPGAQDALVSRLFDDYFTQGADVGDHATLVAAAVAAGFDGDAAGELLASGGFYQQVRDDQAEAHERGISGVPAFVIDHQWVIPGAQDTERMVQLLSRVLERS